MVSAAVPLSLSSSCFVIVFALMCRFEFMYVTTRHLPSWPNCQRIVMVIKERQNNLKEIYLWEVLKEMQFRFLWIRFPMYGEMTLCPFGYIFKKSNGCEIIEKIHKKYLLWCIKYFCNVRYLKLYLEIVHLNLTSTHIYC